LVLEVPDKPSVCVYGVIFKKTIIFTFTALRTSNLFWNKNPENVTLTSTEKFTDFTHPFAHQPPSHSTTSSTPTNGNNQHTVFYVLDLWLDEWEGCSTGTEGVPQL
jgi:hypothetical protein